VNGRAGFASTTNLIVCANVCWPAGRQAGDPGGQACDQAASPPAASQPAGMPAQAGDPPMSIVSCGTAHGHRTSKKLASRVAAVEATQAEVLAASHDLTGHRRGGTCIRGWADRWVYKGPWHSSVARSEPDVAQQTARAVLARCCSWRRSAPAQRAVTYMCRHRKGCPRQPYIAGIGTVQQATCWEESTKEEDHEGRVPCP
jgi:hypothetical protein